MKTFSWRKDLKFKAAQCFSGTHATREIYQRSSRDKRLPREACLDLGDVKVVKEGGPQIERGMVFLKGHLPLFFFFFTETLVTSDCRVKGALTRAMSKRRKPL